MPEDLLRKYEKTFWSQPHFHGSEHQRGGRRLSATETDAALFSFGRGGCVWCQTGCRASYSERGSSSTEARRSCRRRTKVCRRRGRRRPIREVVVRGFST